MFSTICYTTIENVSIFRCLLLTYWDRGKMATLSNAFSWMKMLEFGLNFHWSLFLRVKFTMIQHRFRYCFLAEKAPSHYLNQCWPDSLAHICGSSGRWIKEVIIWGAWSKAQEYYSDVIMGAIMFQITSLTIVYSTVHSGADQRKHQSSAALAYVRGIHRWPVNSPHKWPVTRKRFLFDDVMTSGDETCNRHSCVAFLQIKRIPFRTNMHRHSDSIWYFAFYIFGWLKACWARTVHSRYPRIILSKHHDRR